MVITKPSQMIVKVLYSRKTVRANPEPWCWIFLHSFWRLTVFSAGRLSLSKSWLFLFITNDTSITTNHILGPLGTLSKSKDICITGSLSSPIKNITFQILSLLFFKWYLSPCSWNLWMVKSYAEASSVYS